MVHCRRPVLKIWSRRRCDSVYSRIAIMTYSQISSSSRERRIAPRRSGLFTGASYPFQALALLMRMPRLWGYIFIPLLVNILVGATLYAGLLFLGWRAIDQLVANLAGWGAILAALLRAVLI